MSLRTYDARMTETANNIVYCTFTTTQFVNASWHAYLSPVYITVEAMIKHIRTILIVHLLLRMLLLPDKLNP